MCNGLLTALFAAALCAACAGVTDPPETPALDAGARSDGGSTRTDGGASNDGGANVVDAGANVVDGGANGGDGGASVEDGGMGVDGGSVLASWIGGPCDSAASCDFVMPECLRDAAGAAWPGGTCTQACTQFCPDRAGAPVTFCVDDEAALGRCLSRCDAGTDCRAGYLCETRGRFNEPTTLRKVCVPPSPRPASNAPSVYPARRTAAQAHIDHGKLAAALADGGVSAPAGAKILAIKIGGTPAAPRYEYFDYQSTAFDDAFWPASAIKLLAGLAAVEALEDRGFTTAANVRYEGGYDGPFRSILDAALIPSDNVAYDRLMLFAGYDELNTEFLSPGRGFTRTVLTRRYGASGSLRSSPAITLSEPGHTAVTLPARTGTGSYDCSNEGNCTNAFELAEAIRRVGMHERLGDGERFHIRAEDEAYLRLALSTNTGTWIYPGAQQVFGASGVMVLHKTGWAGGWKIDNAFLREKATGAEYVLTIAVPDSISDASFNALARVILAAFKAGHLSTAPVVP